jgi:hypothetical protein
MDPVTYSAFAGDRLVAAGALEQLLRRLKAHEAHGGAPALVFEDATGRQVDFDLRGTPDEVVARALPKPGPGRPRLGVVSREVSLLPEHWEWLEAQPAGISGALRRLVDAARKRAPQEERARRAREAASRLMTALAGDRPGYEEATRALFAGDGPKFARLVQRWPKDIREHVLRLSAGAF